MIGSPTVRDLKQEKPLNLKITPKQTRISELKLDLDSPSKQTTDRKSSLKSVLTPTPQSRRSDVNPILSPPARLTSSLPTKIENLLTQSKFDIEEIYYSSEGLWAFKKKISESFDMLRKALIEELQFRYPRGKTFTDKFQPSTPEVKTIIKDLTKSKGLVNSLHKDLEKKLPMIGEYEKKLREMSEDLELEKTKNTELSFRLSKIEIERDALMNTNNSILNSLRNSRNESKEILEILDHSPLSSPKQSAFSKKHLSFFSNKSDLDENGAILSSLSKENEELKRNLELIIHNYDNLCGKMKIQREDFQRYRDQMEESKFFHEVKVRDLFFDLYLKICTEEENKLRLNSQFSSHPQMFFNELLKKYEKVKENYEIQVFLLEKSQEENKNLLSKIAGDKELNLKLEKEIKSQVSNELALAKCEIVRQKEKKRNFKQKLNETVNNFQVKFLENQSLSEEIHLIQSQESRIHDEVQAKNREIDSITKENDFKYSQIQDLKRNIKDKELEMQELRMSLSKINKLEIEKEKEFLASKHLIENLQNSLNSARKQLEVAETKNQTLEYNLKLKETEIKGIENKLNLQISINERLKDSAQSSKLEIIKKYQEKLEEKEKIFQETQELNESLAKRLENYSKTIQNYEQKTRDSESSQVLRKEINDSKQMMQTLITRLSARTGESFLDPLGTLKDCIRIIDSLSIILINNLDSANTQVKLSHLECSKMQEDIHKYQLTVQELSLKSASYENSLKSAETDKFFLKEKCSTRKNSLISAESQIKDKEMIHLQTLQNLRDKFSAKKEKLKERIRNKDFEINELKKKTQDGGVKSETFLLLQEREKNLKAIVDELNLKYANLAEELGKMKKIKEDDEKLIYKQNKSILKLESHRDELLKSEMDLKQQKENILQESNEKIKGLQENLNLMILKKQEEDEDSLKEDSDEYGEEHVSKLFKQIQEKEAVIKKANKRIMELQWAHRDVIDQCKEHEDKYLAQLEIQEKMTEENDRLNTLINSLNEKISDYQKTEEDLREKIKQFRESEISFKKLELQYKDTIEELKIKCLNFEDEISGFQSENSEYQLILKNYADDNSSLAVTNRTQSDQLKKQREEIEDLIREKQQSSSTISKLKQELISKESLFDIERENFEKLKDVLEKEKLNLELLVNRLQGQHENDDEHIKSLNEEMKRLGEHRNSLRKSTSESLERAESIEKFHDQLHEKTQELLEVQEMCSELQKEIDDLQNDFSIKELTFNETLLKGSQEILSLKNEVKTLKSEKKRLDLQFEELKKMTDKLKSEVYDRNTQIQKLEQEKKLMNDYMKEKLEGEELDSLLKVKQKITDLIEENRVLQDQLTSTRQNYEEIVESLKNELGMLNKYKSSSNKSMWTHVDQLNKQLEEKSRMVMNLESQLSRKSSKDD